ncbi:glycerophosphodiester phosphodiesterase [Nitrosomonas communis]|uniref:Glycerophosphoryl diester phosphodiesterase n=1 Tax=Nitrosomonas communis TaxID=44574 RepID=A0A1I4IWS4_9PROT|nr:glycerophosphodiester phosphodiesterase [Nitrosomonas communis]SFL58832.1 glycerophosphoryl diester phosphodiesterase [Nitrosomonas communis]
MGAFLISFLESAYALEVQGHRGARWMRPENTLPAFEYALQVGVDTLELDTLITKDDQVVVHHDPALNPNICLDPRGKKLTAQILIRSLTLKELKGYDCGSLVNPSFPQQIAQPKTPIPTLDEVFEMVEKSKLHTAKKVHFNIEIKSEETHPEYSPSPDKFVKLVLAVVKKHNLMNRVILQSFDLRTLKIARQLEPKLPLSILIEDRPAEAGALVKLMKAYQAQILSPNYEWLTAQDVAEIHEMEARVIPWTPNTKEDWQSIIKKGVDGIITDNPKKLLDFLKR